LRRLFSLATDLTGWHDTNRMGDAVALNQNISPQARAATPALSSAFERQVNLPEWQHDMAHDDRYGNGEESRSPGGKHGGLPCKEQHRKAAERHQAGDDESFRRTRLPQNFFVAKFATASPGRPSPRFERD